MGIDVSAYVVVGFSIDGFQFWDKEVIDKKECKKGHETTNLEAAFCDICGTKLNYMVEETPTKEFSRLCEELYPKEDAHRVYKFLVEDPWEDGVGLWQSKKGYDAEPDIFGMRLGGTGSHRDNNHMCSIASGAINNAIKEMKKYKKILKVPEPIELHVLLSAG